MQVTVRRATPEDAESISAMWEVVCAERVYREGVFLAEVEGRAVGFQSLDLWAKYTDSFDHVGVMGTIILPAWRRRGIGRRLAEHVLDFARANGYEKIVIYVRAGNAGAQDFYRNLGFVPKGVLARQVKIDGQCEDEIFMELFLV
jgi:ribosomal protein S18 acetylase RimI-like enzyme